MTYKVVAFDLDGVLVEEPSAWWTLHKEFGTLEGSTPNLRAYKEREIDYPEFMRRDIALWGPRTLEEVTQILHRFTLTDGAPEAVASLRERGYDVAIVSAGIDILADAVASTLGIEHWVANGLHVDGAGYLSGEGVFRVELLEKQHALRALIEPLGVDLSEVVAVGDSQYDVPLMQATGGAVAFVGNVTDHSWVKEGWPRVRRMADLLKFFP